MLSALTSYFAACASKSFFGIPSWHKYLPTVDRGGNCEVVVTFMKGDTLDLSALFLVGLGIVDLLLRVGSLVAVGYIVYAGVQYVTAQGEPDKAKRALGTIINALIGLGITIAAAGIVSFVGSRIGTDV